MGGVGGEIVRFLAWGAVGIVAAAVLVVWVVLQGAGVELHGWTSLWADGWDIGFAVALPVVMLVVWDRAPWVLALTFGMTVVIALTWAWHADNGFLTYLVGVSGPALLWPFGGTVVMLVVFGLALRAGEEIVERMARANLEKAQIISALVKLSSRVCLGVLFGVFPGVLAGAGSGGFLSFLLYLTTELWVEFVDSFIGQGGTFLGFTKAEEFGFILGGLAGIPGGILGGVLGVWRFNFVGGLLGGFVGGLGLALASVGFVFGAIAGERFGLFSGGWYGGLFSGLLIGGGLLGATLVVYVLLHRLRDRITRKLDAPKKPELW